MDITSHRRYLQNLLGDWCEFHENPVEWKSYFTGECKWISVCTSNIYSPVWAVVGTRNLHIMLLSISEFSKHRGREGRTFLAGASEMTQTLCTVNNYPHNISTATKALTKVCILHHEGQLLQSCCEGLRDGLQMAQQNWKGKRILCFVTRNCPYINLNRLKWTTKQRHRDSN